MIRFNPTTNQTIILNDDNTGLLLSGDHRTVIDETHLINTVNFNEVHQTTANDHCLYDYGLTSIAETYKKDNEWITEHKWFTVIDGDGWRGYADKQSAINYTIDYHFPELVTDTKTIDLFEHFSK